MKTRFLSTLTLLFATFSLATPTAWAGGESSVGGADDYRIIPAFFLNSAPEVPVIACYEIARDFGIEAPAIEPMIRSAFKQWGDYIEAKKLMIVPSRYLIQTQLTLKQGCTGTENLRFLFGIQSPEIDRYKSQFSKPFGFAQLTDTTDNLNGTQGHKGFVWIAPTGSVNPSAGIPNWNPGTRAALAGLLLHEVGHVFGNGHVDGTVMTEKIGQYLENDTATAQVGRFVDFYSTIDSRVELVPCMECERQYAAAETFDPIQLPGAGATSDWDATFKLLMGRDPVAPVTLHYERVGSPEGSGVLSVLDSLGSARFPITTEMHLSERQDSTPLFSGQGGINFYSFGISYYSHIRTQAGDEIPVALNYNMDEKKVQILPLGLGFYPRPIFVSAD